MKTGDKVRLFEIPEEGIPEEVGTIIRVEEGVLLVELDNEYRDGEWDDGLRETSPTLVELLAG